MAMDRGETMGGGAFAGVTGVAVGWVIGFLIGLLLGMAIGERRGIYRGMQLQAAQAEAAQGGRWWRRARRGG